MRINDYGVELGEIHLVHSSVKFVPIAEEENGFCRQ